MARVELGAQDYTDKRLFLRQPHRRHRHFPAARLERALDGAGGARGTRGCFENLSARHDLPGSVQSDRILAQSISAVERTLFEAIVLVALVVLVFLQSWRAALVPISPYRFRSSAPLRRCAAFGFSLNNLSLFGMVLAIGIVVDDAIVVVENIERVMREEKLSPREAAHRTMDEVSRRADRHRAGADGRVHSDRADPRHFRPVLQAVRAHHRGRDGDLVLGLADALAGACRADPEAASTDETLRWARRAPGFFARFSRGFNAGFANLSQRYGMFTARAIRTLAMIGVAYVVLIVLAVWRLSATPTGFIPAQDQGYLIGVIQMPPGASLQRTDEVLRQAQAIALKNAGTRATVAFAGFDGATFTTAPNAAAMFVPLKESGEREAGAQDHRGAAAARSVPSPPA